MALRLKANRRFPSIPVVVDDPANHTQVLMAVKEALDIGQRRTSDLLNSFIRVEDLIDLGFITIEGNTNSIVGADLSQIANIGDLTGAAEGDFLRFEGGQWINDQLALTDITQAMVTQHQAALSIAYGQITGAPSIPNDLDDLSDVDLSTPPSTNDVLMFNGSEWVATALGGGGGPIYLDDILDVDAPYPNPGDVLTWDGYSWVNEAPSGGTDGDPLFPLVLFLSGFEGSDGSTTIVDEGPRKVGVSVNGNAQVDTAQSKAGASSLLLDGTGDYLIVGLAEYVNPEHPFTVEAWVRANAFPTLPRYIAAATSSTYTSGFLIAVRSVSGNPQFFADLGNGSTENIIGGGPNLSTGQWYHVALSYDGVTARLFVDGVLVASVAVAINMSTQRLYIGRDPNNTNRDWNGWIDELRVTEACRYKTNFTPETEFPRS